MTTYAIKVQNTMRSTNPRYNTEGPMTLYHYIGRNGWMSGQPMYEGYSTLRGAKIGLAAYMKQHEDFIKTPTFGATGSPHFVPIVVQEWTMWKNERFWSLEKGRQRK